MRRKVVLFDLDGTLINSLPDISGCMNTVLKQHGLPVHPQDAYRHFIGNGSRVMAGRAAGNVTAEMHEALYADYCPLYAAHCYDLSFVYDGIKELLDALRSDGLRLAVFSNKEDPDVLNMINHYFPADTFEIIRGHLPHMPLKPDPAGALAIAAEMGVSPAECWYLGDTAVDINTCHAAGMELIAVSWGFRSTEELIAAGAERIVDTPFQALSVIRSEN